MYCGRRLVLCRIPAVIAAKVCPVDGPAAGCVFKFELGRVAMRRNESWVNVQVGVSSGAHPYLRGFSRKRSSRNFRSLTCGDRVGDGMHYGLRHGSWRYVHVVTAQLKMVDRQVIFLYQEAFGRIIVHSS